MSRGVLTVSDGGTVVAKRLLSDLDINGDGTISLDGQSSSIHTSTYTMLGYLGKGTATVSNGATLRSDGAGGVTIAYQAGSQGVLNIGAAEGETAVAAGNIIAANGVQFGAGDGKIVFNHTDQNYNFATAISGGGKIQVENGNTWLTAENSYSGGTSISGGSLTGSVGSFGSGSIINNATLVLNQNTDGTLSNHLSGTGTFIKQGTGHVSLGDVSAFNGSTNIQAGGLLLAGSALYGTVTIDPEGTLQVGNGTTDGDLLANTQNNGKLIFHQVGNYDYTGSLSGSGQLVKKGSGTLLLSGTYTYTGSTIVEDGNLILTSQLDKRTDLVIDNGSFDLGGKNQEVASLNGQSGTLALGSSGSLTVNQQTDTTFAGGLSGSSNFIKTGSGRLNLTGQSTFTGTMNVSGGVLAVNGTLPAHIKITNGGFLGGTGSTGNVTVHAGGSMAPGNSIGTLHVVGNIVFENNSNYVVELDANGRSDKIEATGTANIQGGTVAVLAASGNYRHSTDYVILSAAGGVTGTFAKANINLPFLAHMLAYNPTSVVLTLVRNDRSFASVAATENQKAVATALDKLSITNPLHRAVAGLSDTSTARQAFDALSGEVWATANTFIVERARRVNELVVGRLRAAPTGHGIAMWGQAIGAWAQAGSDGNAARATHDQKGLIAGIDTTGGDWRLGAAISYSEGGVSTGSASANLKSTTASLYAGGELGAFQIRLGGTYGWHGVSGNRSVAFPGFSEFVEGNYSANSVSGFADIGYRMTFDSIVLEPFAGINHVHMSTSGFSEKGNIAGLAVGSTSRDVTFTSLGIRLNTDVKISEELTISPSLSVAWQHAFGDIHSQINNSIQGAAFASAGLPTAKDSLAIEAGIKASIGTNASLNVSYVGNIGKQWNDHGVKLGFSYGF